MHVNKAGHCAEVLQTCVSLCGEDECAQCILLNVLDHGLRVGSRGKCLPLGSSVREHERSEKLLWPTEGKALEIG